MRLLLDSHILIWTAANSNKLPPNAADLINDAENTLYFSVASIWEIAIKTSLGRADFKINPKTLRARLIENSYCELPISIDHLVVMSELPFHHRDPFDRMLIAQAKSDGMALLTSDTTVATYGGNVIKV